MTPPPPDHSSRRALRVTGLVLIGILASQIALVLALRVLPPPTTGIMIERRLESWSGTLPFETGSPARPHYEKRYHWVPLEQISPLMGIAAIASEDQEFAEHSGFDWAAIVRAIEYNQKHRQLRGASTISQQTAKNLFLWNGRTLLRKALEAYFTVLIETFWSKERILEVYLNIVEFGDGIYGVDAAARQFFHKPAARLTAHEAALLAAVLPNPHVYHADRPGAYLQGRQEWILKNMRQLGGAAYLQHLENP